MMVSPGTGFGKERVKLEFTLYHFSVSLLTWWVRQRKYSILAMATSDLLQVWILYKYFCGHGFKVEAACSFLAVQTQNTHSETVLNTTLLNPLA